MNLALLSHVADETSGGLTATLDPEAGRCCVTLAAD